MLQPGTGRVEKSGEGGIRTLDSHKAIPIFETGPFNRSGTSPIGDIIPHIAPGENPRFGGQVHFLSAM